MVNLFLARATPNLFPNLWSKVSPCCACDFDTYSFVSDRTFLFFWLFFWERLNKMSLKFNGSTVNPPPAVGHPLCYLQEETNYYGDSQVAMTFLLCLIVNLHELYWISMYRNWYCISLVVKNVSSSRCRKRGRQHCRVTSSCLLHCMEAN